jgi:hypothetical protein
VCDGLDNDCSITTHESSLTSVCVAMCGDVEVDGVERCEDGLWSSCEPTAGCGGVR